MTSSTVRSGVDTYVASPKPARNFHGSGVLYLQGGSRIALGRWNVPVPRGATVTSAQLVFFQNADATGTFALTAQLLASGLSERRATWNDRPAASGPTTSVSKTNPKRGDQWTFDVTEQVQLIASGGRKAHGWQITSGNTGTLMGLRSSNAASLRPYLVVTWSTGPAKPTRITPGVGDTSLARPVVTSDYVDTAGDTRMTAMQVQIDPTADWTGADLWDSGTVLTSDPQMNLATQVSTLSGGALYPGLADGARTSMRVRVRDSAIWSPWSDPVTFGRKAKGTLTLNSPGALGDVVATNYVHDPSTNDGTISPWGPYSAVSAAHVVTTSEVVDGRRAIRVEKVTTSANLGAVTSGLTSRPAGQKVTLSAWVRLPATGSTITTVSFIARDNPNNDSAVLENVTSGAISHSVPRDGRWYRIHVTGTVKAARNLTTIYVNGTGGEIPPGQVMHVRDVMLTDGDLVTFFDGDTPDSFTNEHEWTGTPYASTSTRRGLPYVAEFTPPIAWTFTPPAGLAQSAFQVVIYDVTDDVAKPVHTTDKIAGTANSWTVPARVLRASGQTYRVVLRVWDTWDEREATAGDPTYVQVSRDFVVTPGTAAAPTGLTATQVGESPSISLQWSRSTFPDSWTILRDGQAIESGVEAVDLSLGGTTFGYVDHGARPSVAHTYEVRADVNGTLTAAASATITPAVVGIWLVDPDTGDAVVLGGKDGIQVTAEDLATTYAVAGSTEVVRSVMAVTGRVGSCSGLMLRTRNGTSWETYEKRLLRWKGRPTDTFRLTIGDDNMPVVLGDVVVHSHPDTRADQVLRLAGFRWWQTAEHGFAVRF